MIVVWGPKSIPLNATDWGFSIKRSACCIDNNWAFSVRFSSDVPTTDSVREGAVGMEAENDDNFEAEFTAVKTSWDFKGKSISTPTDALGSPPIQTPTKTVITAVASQCEWDEELGLACLAFGSTRYFRSRVNKSALF